MCTACSVEHYWLVKEEIIPSSTCFVIRKRQEQITLVGSWFSFFLYKQAPFLCWCKYFKIARRKIQPIGITNQTWPVPKIDINGQTNQSVQNFLKTFSVFNCFATNNSKKKIAAKTWLVSLKHFFLSTSKTLQPSDSRPACLHDALQHWGFV